MVNSNFYNSQLASVSCPFNAAINARKLAGELWLDLSGRIYRQILGQPYESHLSGNVTSLADLLSNLEALLRDISSLIESSKLYN